MRLIALIALIFTLNLFAKPATVEVWFLSADSLATTGTQLFSTSIAFAAKNCVPMGEGCFHPQLGYIEDESKSKVNLVETDRTIPEEGIDLIDCDHKDYFNIFCKSKTATQEFYPRVEVWVDYSSSLRILDPSDEKGGCLRSAFIRDLKGKCKAKRIDFSIFNTSLKQLGVPEDVCTNYGTNNTKKLIKWIEASLVKKLYIITDIDEHNRELKEYLDSIGAKIVGVDFEGITAKTLGSKISTIISSCNKIAPLKK